MRWLSMMRPALFLVMAGCWIGSDEWAKWEEGHGSDDSGVGIDPVDDDGDGYSEMEGDCDDANPAINPAATDVVGDGIDQNCDHVDGIDADGDSHASVASGGEDCDDLDAAVFPGATDTWYDGVDQDCDGWSDYDQDHDGHDSDDAGGDDCDDEDALSHPGADEICEDGVANDCDRSENDLLHECLGMEDLGDAYAVIVAVDGLDDAGTSVAGGVDLSGDGVPDLVVGAPSAEWGGGAVGIAYVLDGLVTGDTTVAASRARIHGEIGDTMGGAGTSLATVGDVSGNGHPGLLLGDPSRYYEASIQMAGAVYLLESPIVGDVSVNEADARIIAQQYGADFGESIAGAGDLDSDGRADFIVGAYCDGTAGSCAGAAYIFQGPVSGDHTPAEATAKLLGTSEYAYAGHAVGGGGDFDGDGHDDVVVGCDGEDSRAGAAYVVLGPASGIQSLGAAYLQATGEQQGDFAGSSATFAGDMEGDGYDDILVGAEMYSEGIHTGLGAVYLVSGPRSGTMSLSLATARLVGSDDYAYTGLAVARVGDFDADGTPDVAVGALCLDSSTGGVYLLRGPLSGSIGIEDAGLLLPGEGAGDRAGSALSSAGDLDADGYDDLLVGAMWADQTGTQAGAAYVILGTSF